MRVTYKGPRYPYASDALWVGSWRLPRDQEVPYVPEDVAEEAKQVRGHKVEVEHDREPFKDFNKLDADDVVKRLRRLSPEQVAEAQAYEAAHKDRKSVLEYEPTQEED